MHIERYKKADDVYSSMLYSRGLYEWRGDWLDDPYGQIVTDESMSPVLTNIVSGEKFYTERVECGPSGLLQYSECIRNPIQHDLGFWPVDIIRLDDNLMTKQFSLFVQQEYRDIPTPKEGWPGHYALLFPLYPVERCGAVERADARLARIGCEQGWKSEAIRHMAIQITRAIDRLNARGYAYCDMHLSRFFFEGSSCRLSFSNLVYPIRSLEDDRTKSIRAPKVGEYPLEFAEPAYVQGKIDAMDMRTQNYSLSALLFFLLLGHYAYDGVLVEHLHGNDPTSHYNMLYACMETPVFIFDPLYHDNEVDASVRRNRNTLALWESLPPDMRGLFLTALSKDAAERKTDYMVNPRDWLNCFTANEWVS